MKMSEENRPGQHRLWLSLANWLQRWFSSATGLGLVSYFVTAARKVTFDDKIRA
jgi:hypothetical protein